MARIYYCPEGDHHFIVGEDEDLVQYCPLHPESLGVLVTLVEEGEEAFPSGTFEVVSEGE